MTGAEHTTVTCPKCLLRILEAVNFCPSCGEDLRGLTSTSDTLAGQLAGRIIEGRYKLIEKLGEGGMGTVFKVEHVRMGKILALKLLRRDLALDKKLKNRFIQEARLVSRLSHPNTIQVFDFGELEDGSLYIAMEFLPGRDLAWVLRAKGYLSESKAIGIATQVLSSLAEAHDHNIIHRDIKPANVMLVQQRDRDDWVKVLDFGIAKLNETEARKHITGAADLLGTPQYMSPEQAKGDELDHRSDLYSLGAMLFELVTGRGVFDGPTPMSIVTKHMTEEPPRFSEVCPEKKLSLSLENVILRSLEKDRSKRFSSAEEMRDALLGVRRGARTHTADFTPIPNVNPAQVARREDFDRFERSLRTKRMVIPLAVLALLANLGLLGWFYLTHPPEDGPSTSEIEPNNEPEQATRIGLSLPVSGTIGKPVSETESDRDVFVIEIPHRMPVSVEVTGVPDMNLVLELFQLELSAPNEKIRLSPRLVVDDAPEGQGERVDGFIASKGPLYIRIQERHYFTEPARPPREKTNFAYKLTVSPTEGPGHFEEEPNDTPEQSAPLTTERAITAFTGAPIPYEQAYVTEALSTVDFFGSGPESRVDAVIIVPPLHGTLLAVENTAFQTWRKTLSERGDVNLPAPMIISSKSVLFPLRASRGIRIQPTGSTKAGSLYFLAAVSHSPAGLGAALQLVQTLKAINRDEDAAHVLSLAKEAFPQSTQLAEIERVLSSARP